MGHCWPAERLSMADILIVKDSKTMVPKIGVTAVERSKWMREFAIYDVNADGSKSGPFGPTDVARNSGSVPVAGIDDIQIAISDSDDIQRLIDRASLDSSVLEIPIGSLSDIGGGVYRINQTFEPHEVFINDIRANRFTSVLGFTDGSFFDLAPSADDVAWVYDKAAQKLYVYAKGVAPVSLVAVKYSIVSIDGNNAGPIFMKPGVWLAGTKPDATAIINDGVASSYTQPVGENYYTSAIHAARYARVSNLSAITRNIKQPDAVVSDTDISTAYATSAMVFNEGSICDCFIAENVRARVEGSPGIAIRNNAVDLACSDLVGGRANGVLFIDCDIEAPTYGYSIETQTAHYPGWFRVIRGVVTGPMFIDGSANSAEFDGTRQRFIRDDGSACAFPPSRATDAGAITASSVAKSPARPYLYALRGMTIDAPSGLSFPLLNGTVPDKVLFDACNVGVDMGPVGVSFSTITAAALAKYYARASRLPVFSVQSFSASERCPMGITAIAANTSASSAAGGAVLSGFQVSPDEPAGNWAFEAEWSGTFAANANNKQLTFQAGIAGAVATLLDTTALAFNGGAWTIRLTANKVGTNVYAKVQFMSGSSVLYSKSAAATYTPTSVQSMQFQITGTAAANDVVLKNTTVRPA